MKIKTDADYILVYNYDNGVWKKRQYKGYKTVVKGIKSLLNKGYNQIRIFKLIDAIDSKLDIIPFLNKVKSL
jgi:hypothetical protein